jgi:hypothetical protein
MVDHAKTSGAGSQAEVETVHAAIVEIKHGIESQTREEAAAPRPVAFHDAFDVDRLLTFHGADIRPMPAVPGRPPGLSSEAWPLAGGRDHPASHSPYRRIGKGRNQMSQPAWRYDDVIVHKGDNLIAGELQALLDGRNMSGFSHPIDA